jgi:hypothetical protein
MVHQPDRQNWSAAKVEKRAISFQIRLKAMARLKQELKKGRTALIHDTKLSRMFAASEQDLA